MRISEKLKERRTTPYKEIANRFNTTVIYVGQIARGERIPKRKSGKAMKVLEALKEMCNE